MLYVTEQSWRERKKQQRGTAKLCQSVYIAATASTFSSIKYRKFPTIGGSTRSDVMGPVDYDKISDLQTMAAADKKTYYGKHFVLAGGRAESDSGEDDETEDQDEEEPDTEESNKTVPISWHCLPSSVVTNLVDGFNVKHLIDLAATPTPLAFEVISKGGSYVGVTATPMMNSTLKNMLFKKLILGIVDPKQRLLHDPRFASDAVNAG